jgi:hypothetical protein
MAGADHTLATWRKSSYSAPNGSNCVEVATTWRKSSYSGGNGSECVEVATANPAVLVRDTANRPGAVLEFAPAAWRIFAAGLKAGPRA